MGALRDKPIDGSMGEAPSSRHVHGKTEWKYAENNPNWLRRS